MSEQNPDVPVPRYRIGQTVWVAIVDKSVERLPCPDCLGTHEWKLVTPAGQELAVSCQRCTGVTFKIRPPQRVVHKPRASELTIGSIRIDTHPSWASESPVSYMCAETGVGSGTIHYESDLFADEAEALRVAEMKAKLSDSKQAEESNELNRENLDSLFIRDAIQEEGRRALSLLHSMVIAVKEMAIDDVTSDEYQDFENVDEARQRAWEIAAYYQRSMHTELSGGLL